MSESEQMGRLRREIAAAYEGCSIQPNKSDWLIADALDRLAADVAAVRASVERIEAVATTTAVTLTPPSGALQMAFDHPPGDSKPLRSALRDKEAEVERLKAELDDREQTEQVKRLREENERQHRASLNYINDRDQYKRQRDQALAEVELLKAARDSVIHLYGKEQDEVERLKAELAAQATDGNSSEIPNSSPAAPQPAGQGISPGLPETQSTRNAAPAAGWLTPEEREAAACAAGLCIGGVVGAYLARTAPPAAS